MEEIKTTEEFSLEDTVVSTEIDMSQFTYKERVLGQPSIISREERKRRTAKKKQALRMKKQERLVLKAKRNR